MQRLQRLKYWWQLRGAPFVKKNKIPLIISAVAIGFIIFFLVKLNQQAKEARDPTVRTEKSESGLTGKDVKKTLLSWKSGDRYAYIVVEASQIAYHYDENFKHNVYSTLFMNGQQTASIDTNLGSTMMWGINYGSVLGRDVVQADGKNYYTQFGILKKDKTYEGDKLDSKGRPQKIVYRKKENPYTLKTGIPIPDDEQYNKTKLLNDKGEEIGTVFYPTTLILPRNYEGNVK